MTSDTIFLQPLSRLLGTSPASDFGLYGAQPVPGSLPSGTTMAIAPIPRSPGQANAEETQHSSAAPIQGIDTFYTSAAHVTDALPPPLLSWTSASPNTPAAVVVIAQSDAAKGIGSLDQLLQTRWIGEGPNALNGASAANQPDIGPIALQDTVATPASPGTVAQNGAFSDSIVLPTAALSTAAPAALLPAATEVVSGLVTVPVAQLQMPELAETATNVIQLPLEVLPAGGLIAPLLEEVATSIGNPVTTAVAPVLDATTIVAELAHIAPAGAAVAPIIDGIAASLVEPVAQIVAPALEVTTTVAALAPVEAAVNVVAEAGQVLAPIAEAIEPPLSGAAPLLATVTEAASPLVEEPLHDMLGSDPAAGIQTVVSLVSAADVIDLRQAVGAEESAATENPLGEMLDTLASDAPLEPLDDVFDLGLSHDGFGSHGGDDLLGLGL